MKYKVLGYAFIILVFAATVSVLYYQSVKNNIPNNFFLPVHREPTTKTYQNAEYGFQFNYDKNYEIDISGNQANFFKHTAKSLVSSSIPQSLYPATNFGSANLTVAVQPQSQESSCTVSTDKTEEINGILFHKSENTGAAAGTRYQTKIYRVFYNQDCFEVSLTIGVANIGNYTPGTVTEVDQNDIWNRLDQLLQTFKFTDSNPQAGKGILMGHADVGPICPVERVGQPCTPSPEAYMARQVGVFAQDSSKLIASQHLDTSGNYHFDLAPGIYDVRASGMMVDQLTALEGTVTIKAGQTATLNFSIDTGIR